MMNEHKLVSAIFITFSGNCKKALTFYQTCFGGSLQFQFFERDLLGFKNVPIVCGSLVSERISIHGSDLLHDEGRRLGNYIAVFLHCKNNKERKKIVEKLLFDQQKDVVEYEELKLIEVTDAFDVRWMLGC